jgi:ABC-type Fe3+ transport system permease subunit
MLAVFAMPPAMTALGLVYLGADAPAWADPILRSRLTVCVALGLRFLPVAAVIGLWASGSASPSWAQAAGLHGVPLGTYLRRILLPFLLPAGLLSCMLIALLATADIGTVLLLHPPGAGSLPLAIFTVMANAPQSLVASLCVIYVALAALLVAGVWTIAGKQRR